MSADALAKAREIAARLSGSIASTGGGGDAGKKRNRWGEDAAGLGSIKTKKIYIPIDEYPDVNFLGLLIGPKGATQKQLQESSGAKILIRGRGASKDGGPSSTGHPDDQDSLHVFIEGPEDCVDKAIYEVEKILFNPEQAQRLKSEQLRHLAEMNSSNNDSHYGNGGSSEYQVELRVPNSMVGLIIGKGGENILRIQSQLQVHVQIAKESEMKPGETVRSIIIKGAQDNVQDAKRRIDDIIDGQNSKMQAPSSLQAKQLDHPFIVKLQVPHERVGVIIGKGGMTIKGIQERTKTTVIIPPNPDEDNPQIRTVSIGGDTKEALDQCQMEILLAIQTSQQNQQQSYGTQYPTMQMTIPDDRVGIVIGKGGATIKDIQNRLQVKVQIPQAPDVGSYPPVRTISIVGPAEFQPVAKYEIEMIVAGTPVHSLGGGAASAASNYGYGAASAYGAPSYYTDPAYAAAAAYQYGYYGAAAAAPTAAATTTAAAGKEEVPTDPKAYYNDFWLYAQYYGEAAARLYYGAWSPPEGTPAPEGMVIPQVDAATVAAAAAAATPAAVATTVTPATVAAASTSSAVDAVDPAAAATAWEDYKKQYAEWYEKYGKAAGADPNPPAMQ